MALGDVGTNIQTGGGRATVNAAQVARTPIVLNVSPGGTPNTAYLISSPGGIAAALGDAAAALAEEVALLLRHGAPQVIAVPLTPSEAGGLTTTLAPAASNTGSGTITPSAVPHKVIDLVCVTGGALGTTTFQFRVGGSGNAYGAVQTSTATSWVYRVPGTFCTLTFSAGTYVAGSSASIGVDGTVTPSGTDAAGSATSSSATVNILPAQTTVVKIDEGSSQTWTWGGTAGYCKMAAAGAYSGNVAGTFTVRRNGDSATDTLITVPSGVAAGELALLTKLNDLLIAAGVPVVAEDSGDSNKLQFRSEHNGTSSTVAITTLSGAGFTTETGIAITASTASGTATCTKSGGTGTKTVTIADMTVATPTEIVAAIVAADGLTGGTWSAPTSTTQKIISSTTGASPKGVQVMNTSTNSLGFDNTEHNGITGGEISALTQSSDPIDAYEIEATVVKAGALGVAVLSVSLDNGISTLPQMVVPAAGKVVIPGAGILLTCASTFVAGDSYSGLSIGPGSSTSDVSAALTAIAALDSVKGGIVHVAGLPASAAAAISMAATLQAGIDAAEAVHRDWQGLSECPSADTKVDGAVVGDIVVGAGPVAKRDTADTTAVIVTARAGQDNKRCALAASCRRITSALTSRKQLRPFGWTMLARFVEIDPANSVAEVNLGSLDTFGLDGRDELYTSGLDDAGLNVPRSYYNETGAFLAITSGSYGFKNLTTDDAMKDADGVRALNILVAAVRTAGYKYLGSRPATNPDGTIEERTARAGDTYLKGVAQRSLGLLKGGTYNVPQASLVDASIDRTSQLGVSPFELTINYTLEKLGFVSDVQDNVRYTGAITIGG